MITRDQVVAATETIVAANPDVVNPRSGADDGSDSYVTGICRYNKVEGDTTPNAAEHCLGGTVLMHFDVMPPPEGMSIRMYSPYETVFEPDAFRFLSRLQSHADAVIHDGGDGEWRNTKWSEALQKTKQELNLT